METKMNNIITLTPKAVEKAKSFSEKRGGYVKFGIRKGGCSGYMYDIGFAKEVSEGDALVRQDGAEVVVPSGAKEFLRGSTIDYQDSLMGAGFRIENPNVTKSCKCGHSVK
ncbi:iron-sulfur cluster assembly accessory protein [Candidatus Woesearchaeota archaeon]|nr:iron-sulfur cluster assembly accessory protein [Candidatus Woesearchaeota archaeon]